MNLRLCLSTRKIGFPRKLDEEMFNFSRNEISFGFSSFCEKSFIKDQCASLFASYHANVRALIRDEKSEAIYS